MLYLNKVLNEIKKNSTLFKIPEIIIALGLSNSHIKDLKKYAFENQLIIQDKQGTFLTEEGEKYLVNNPVKTWVTKDFKFRPEINVEYLKEEKTPAILTKSIRNLAKYYIENIDLKENSLDFALKEDLKNCEKLVLKLEQDLLNTKRNCIQNVFEKYLNLGLTKSLFSVILLAVLCRNLEKIAIYEKSIFQLKFDTLMFDRMVACPQNFEIQQTEMRDEYLIKDISKIILNKKSDNILEITKGLYKIIKSLDKYTMNTQKLTPKTLRLRNTIINAKDPISLFERDIPKALGFKELSDCDRGFLNELKISLNELKNCTTELIKDLKTFIFETFQAKNKEDLSERFLLIKDYINEKELKVLFNNIVEINISEDLWTNRIATYINKFRVPKDWSDEDYASFKIKAKELALKVFVIESTIGSYNANTSKNYFSLLNRYKNLSQSEKMIFLREVINY